MRALLTWIGLTDLKAASGDASVGLGPIAQTVKARAFDHVVLLCDRPKSEGDAFQRWLGGFTSAPIVVRPSPLKSPIDY